MVTRYYLLVVIGIALLGAPGGALARSGARDGQPPPRSKHADDEDNGVGMRSYKPRGAHHGVPGMKVYKPGFAAEKSPRSFEGSEESDHHQRPVDEEEDEE